ncbi:MAG: PQQ-binding-like beta-propeller repeat protein [Thermoplasmatota archaeon]
MNSNHGLADSSWPMYRRNPQHTGRTEYSAKKVDGTVLWSFERRIEFSTPSIGSDGTIYVGSEAKDIYAVNPNGELKWDINRFTTDSTSESPPTIGKDGTVYITSDYGFLKAVNPNGTKKWEFITFGGIYSAPVINDEGIIYFITEGYRLNSDKGKLYALYPNGTEKWSIESGDVRKSPALGNDGTIYINLEKNNLSAISREGKVKWSFKIDGRIITSPTVGEDGTIYFGTDRGELYALNPNGTEKWCFDRYSGYIYTTPAISEEGTVYFGWTNRDYWNKTYRLYALNPDGSIKWINKMSVNGSPTISGEGTIYISERDYLTALNPDGSIRWRKRMEPSSPPVIGNNGTLYLTSFSPYYGLIALGRGYELTINKEGEGDVRHFGFNTEAIPENSEVRLTARAWKDNWTFSHWSGECINGKVKRDEMTIKMNRNKSITAHFIRKDQEKVDKTPGFTIFPFLISSTTVMAYIYKRKEKSFS